MGKGIKEVKEFSDELQTITGKKKGARTDAVKWFWDYVKENDLQNPSNKREILLDNNLKALCGNKKKISMFEVSKYLTPHLL